MATLGSERLTIAVTEYWTKTLSIVMPQILPSPKSLPNGCTFIFFMLTVTLLFPSSVMSRLSLHLKLFSFAAVIISFSELFWAALTFHSSYKNILKLLVHDFHFNKKILPQKVISALRCWAVSGLFVNFWLSHYPPPLLLSVISNTTYKESIIL